MNPSIYKAKLFDLPAWCTLNPAFPPKCPTKEAMFLRLRLFRHYSPVNTFCSEKNKASVAKPDLFHLLRQKHEQVQNTAEHPT